MLLTRSFSHHSLLSAVPKIPALVDNAKAKGYTTLALTDENTGSAFVEFYEYCVKQEIKPVLGFTTSIPNLSKNSESNFGGKEYSKTGVLAKSEKGYKQLLELISIARTEKDLPKPHLDLEDLEKYLSIEQELYVVVGGNDHELVANVRYEKYEQAEKILKKYVAKIGIKNLLVELAIPLYEEQKEDVKKINLKLAEICKAQNVRYIASPAPRYCDSDDEEVFKIVLAIRGGKRAAGVTLERNFYLPSSEELASWYDYLPESMETQDIEDSIDIKLTTNYDKHADDAFFPLFHVGEGQNPGDLLRYETYMGFVSYFSPSKSKDEYKLQFPYEKLDELKRFAFDLVPDTSKLLGYSLDYWTKEKSVNDYMDRIEYELGIIITKGYADYFLVFGDIMRFCRDSGIVTNTRGSAAGSLVGFLNSINILDPMVYTIPFERFLNPLRPSPPDIDGDFADDRRDEVIKYITQKYGETQVCQIITFGTMLPRAAVRDVGRTLGVSYNKCDKLSKLIPVPPQGKKATFKWALETSQELAEVYERDGEVKQIIDFAVRIEANYRHSSCHAAGVIIAPTKTTDYCPLQWDSDHKMIICQYDMRTAEKMGLVKLDILGIRNLAILGNAVAITEQRRDLKIDLLNIDLANSATFDVLSKGRTMGTFQLSGVAMTKYLVELEPTKVQDLMAMVALYRPGPMGSIPEYIKRKKNPKLVEYLVPQMVKWMEPSYGIFVYQEDLLMTAIELAGYDWGQADVLRKGMGKKIQEVIDAQHPIFVDGCVSHSGLDRDTAEHIWSLMVPFGAYGFNKAHSSSYGMVAYWTAYMKAVYTVEFMTAMMTAEGSNLDKIGMAIGECDQLGIDVKPPDVNYSFDGYNIEDNKTIRYGLGSVKNLGSDVIKFMIQNREENGKYISLEDFLDRVSQFQGFSKKSLEALIFAGCLDEIGGQLVDRLGVTSKSLTLS
jgi:DNA polymerase III subunit alpha